MSNQSAAESNTSPQPDSLRWMGVASRLAQFPPAVDEAEIVLQWLARLRWLAVAGQAIATFIAVLLLKIPLPLPAIEGIIAITGISNLLLYLWTTRRPPQWLVPAVLMLDVCLLTALLLCSGGASNPFSALYLVHVAMAVVTLAEGWSWVVVAATTVCYGVLIIAQPIRVLQLSSSVAAWANWISLVLVSILTAYFVGRLARSLRNREKELADFRERAARNEQLASLTTLAAGAAHELNTPLSTIAVVAKELDHQSRQSQLPEQQLRESFSADAQLIRQEVDRCQFILSRMRVDVLQGEWQKPIIIGTGDFVASLRQELGKHSAILKIEFDPALQQLSLPLRAVQQTLAILVDNAASVSPPGKFVYLGILHQSHHLIFQVADQGEGMTPDVARRAGEPFFTTKPPGQGMGLGLYLARLVAERLGGSLKLDSRQGEGTTATLELPEG